MRKLLVPLIIILLASPALSAELHMDDGWNLISYSGSGLTTSSFQQECSLEGGPWAWDTSQNDFVYEDTIDPYKGYWVKLQGDCTVSAASSPEVLDSMELEEGWNLVSVSASIWGVQTLQSSGCELVGGPWADSNTGWRFQETMAPLTGYWIKVDSGCSVDIPSPSDTTDADSGDETGVDSGTRTDGSSESIYSYSTKKSEWRLSQKEYAALAAIPKGMAPNVDYGKFEGQTVAQMVRNLRERAIDYHHWQYQAKDTVQYGDPEDVNVGGKTYFVSSSEGFVLQPGTPAPHCYYDYGYQPPRFGSLSSTVMERTPVVDTIYADTDNDQECPDWLTQEVMNNVQSILERKNSGSDTGLDEGSEQDSDTQETFEDVSWNSWDFESVRFTGSENDQDYLSDVSAGSVLTIDTGDTGYCGKGFVEKRVYISERVKKVTADIDVVNAGQNTRAAIWVDGDLVDSANSEGSHQLVAFVPSDSDVRVGIIGDNEDKSYCDRYGRRMKMEINSIEVDATQFAAQDETQTTSTQETFEDVSWNNWDFESERFTASETQNKEDYLGDVSSGESLVIDTGYDGFCGKAFIKKPFGISDRAKRVTADIEVLREGTGVKAAIWDDETMVDTASSKGSHSLAVEFARDSTIKIGVVGDTENKDQCDEYSRWFELEVEEVSVESTNYAIR